MSDNSINIESDSEGNTSSYSKMEEMHGDSTRERDSSSDSLKAPLLVNSNGGEDSIENRCFSPVLTELEIKAVQQRREHVGKFVWLYRGRNGHEPNDARIKIHLEYWGMSNVVSWMDPGNHFKANELDRKGIRSVEHYWGYNQCWHYGENALRLVGSFSLSWEEDKQLFWGLLGSFIRIPLHHVKGTFYLF